MEALGKNPCSGLARAAPSLGANRTHKAACSAWKCEEHLGRGDYGRGGCGRPSALVRLCGVVSNNSLGQFKPSCLSLRSFALRPGRPVFLRPASSPVQWEWQCSRPPLPTGDAFRGPGGA